MDVTVDIGPLLRATGFIMHTLVTRVAAKSDDGHDIVVAELRERVDAHLGH